MDYLPCVRWGRQRWWLPLERNSADLLATLLMESIDTSTTSGSAVNRSPSVVRLRNQLLADPSLFLFVALRFSETSANRPSPVMTPTRLATWFLQNLLPCFSTPDRVLGMPVMTDVRRLAMQELAIEFLNLSPERWLRRADDWLTLDGPRAPLSWQAAWPEIRLQSDTCREWEATSIPTLTPRYEGSTISLMHLASLGQERNALRTRFDAELQSEKMAGLKQFAYGLTHEINNPLANIVTRSEQLMVDEPDDRRRQSLQRIVDQAMRAHEMLSDVMFFAHPPRPERTRFSLTEMIKECCAELLPQCEPLQIQLHFADAETAAIDCHADRRFIHDALLALLRNAIEAIGDGGKIVVQAGRRGRQVFFSVADSGPGLSESDRRHAFDPYYSGREAGRGLGLGLCRVYRIAKLHQGGASLRGGPAGCLARFWWTDLPPQSSS